MKDKIRMVAVRSCYTLAVLAFVAGVAGGAAFVARTMKDEAAMRSAK